MSYRIYIYIICSAMLSLFSMYNTPIYNIHKCIYNDVRRILILNIPHKNNVLDRSK